MKVYEGPAEVLDRVERQKQSLRTAVYESQGNKSRTLALVSGLLTQKDALERALDVSGCLAALKKEGLLSKPRSRSMALLAAYDVVAGKGLPKRAGGKLVRVLKMHTASLKENFKAKERIPRRRRFGRCNGLAGGTVEIIRNELPETWQDPDVPEVVEFPQVTKAIATHDLVTSGRLLLQDKASCFPAHALRLSGHSGDVLDMCAAPGNKTTQLADYFQSQKVIALDRDPKRLDILERRVNQAHAQNIVQCHLENCLDVDGTMFPNVSAILLDPSCSGSGIHHDSQASDHDRLAELAKFQVTALTQALTKFPNVTRVVYSTCSVHAVENENVVAEALSKAPSFTLEKCIPTWHRRGLPHADLSADESDMLLRADPVLDNINGFFVALFRRRQQRPRSVDNLKRKLHLRRRHFLRNIILESGFSSSSDARKRRRTKAPSQKSSKRVLVGDSLEILEILD